MGSYAANVGINLRGWGAWLQWKLPTREEGLETAGAGEIDFVKLAQAVVERGVASPPPDLIPLEQILYTYLARNASRFKEVLELARSITTKADKKLPLGSVWSPVLRSVKPSDLEKGTRGTAAQSFETHSISSSLGIPQALVTATGASLAKRLGVESGWRGYLPFKLKQ